MTHLQLDHTSRLPLHVQVENLLRQLIRRAEYQNGQFLPDEVTLSRQLGVSRNTLRAGIVRLAYDGLLERRAGVGTRVTHRPLQSGIGAWHSFTQEMRRKGITVQTFDLSANPVPADEAVAQALRIKPETTVLRLDRLRGWDDEPVVHFRSWLHPRLELTGREDFSQPLYQLIQTHSGAVADQTHEEMSAVAADATMVKLLKIKRGTPLLLRRRLVCDASGRPIEYAIVHYLSERFTLTLDIRRERP